MASKRATVVGVFEDRERAERAVDALQREGFTEEEIGLVVRDGGRDESDFRSPMAATVDRDTETEGRETSGALAGSAVGGALGALAALLIPGVGPVLAGGVLAGALGGAAVGAAGGGLAMALSDLGLSDDEARGYEREVVAGRALVTVRAGSRGSDAAGILRRFGAYDLDTLGRYRPDEPGVATAGGPSAVRASDRHLDSIDEVTDRETLELREERLVPRKEMRELGEAVVRTVVESVPSRLEVEAYREEIEVEHLPVGEIVSERKAPWEEGDVVIIPVYEEQLVMVKRLVLKEQLRIRRVANRETRLYEDTVRRERLVVEDPGNTGLVRESYSTDDESPAAEDRPRAEDRPPEEQDESLIEKLGRKILQ
jgi:uncharacterized protein (TIGR02271 family)